MNKLSPLMNKLSPVFCTTKFRSPLTLTQICSMPMKTIMHISMKLTVPSLRNKCLIGGERVTLTALYW